MPKRRNHGKGKSTYCRAEFPETSSALRYRPSASSSPSISSTASTKACRSCCRRAVVGNADPDRRTPPQFSKRGHGYAATLQFHHDMAIEAVQLFRCQVDVVVAETDDIQGNRCQKLELSQLLNLLPQPGGLLAIAMDRLAETLGPHLFQQHPHTQCRKAAGEVDTRIVGPGCTASGPPVLPSQIGMRGGKSTAMLRTIPDQQAGGRIGDMHPFMEIEGDGVGQFDAGKSAPEFRGEREQCPECTIHVMPHARVGTDLADPLQVVDCTGIDGPSHRNHRKRPQATPLIILNHGSQGLAVQGKIVGDRHRPQRPRTQPQQFHSLGHGYMRLRRAVGHQRCSFVAPLAH